MNLPAVLTLREAIPYVAGAYIGIWVVSFGYLFYMGRNLARLQQELTVLAKAVQKKEQ